MNKDKKVPCGASPQQTDAALEDDTVEAVTGGTKAKPSKDWNDDAWDWMNQHFGENDGKEDKP